MQRTLGDKLDGTTWVTPSEHVNNGGKYTDWLPLFKAGKALRRARTASGKFIVWEYCIS